MGAVSAGKICASMGTAVDSFFRAFLLGYLRFHVSEILGVHSDRLLSRNRSSRFQRAERKIEHILVTLRKGALNETRRIFSVSTSPCRPWTEELRFLLHPWVGKSV